MASSAPEEGFLQKGAEGRVVDDAPPLDNEGLLYFGNKLCPYAHRAWWALEELGLGDKIDYVHVELGTEKPAWYSAKVNPFGTVPAVYDHGRAVFESLIIVEYFNDKFATPENSLLPADPLDRAAARLLIARWSDKWSKPLYDLIANTDLSKADELEDAARSALESFETEIERFGTKDSDYLVGHRLSIADIAVVPFLERLAHTLAHYRGFELLPDDGKHTRLRRLLAVVRSRPAFQKTTPDASYIIRVYRDRAKVQLPGREQRRAGATA